MKGRNIVLGMILGILIVVVVGGIGYGLYRIGYSRGYAVGIQETLSIEEGMPLMRQFAVPFIGRDDPDFKFNHNFGFNRMDMYPSRPSFGFSPFFGFMIFVGFATLVGVILYLVFRRQPAEVAQVSEDAGGEKK